MHPPRKYVLSGELIGSMASHFTDISELRGCAKLKPLYAGQNLTGKRILIERHRQRGIGDLLFLTGPLAYLKHICGGNVSFDMYGLCDRSQVLHDSPLLNHRTVLAGPIHYGDLDDYDYHWFIDNVTEHCEEQDQLNVYDALYRQIGIDAAVVDPRFKRPQLSLTATDEKNLDAVFFSVFNERQLDLRQTGYYVVAPLSFSQSRSASYNMWLDVIVELAQRRPVIVMGHAFEGQMPTCDIPFSEFMEQVNSLSKYGVINLVGSTKVRMMMSLIARASALVCLDSGPLYIAQALRVPAVSLWGTHDPVKRIGDDPTYMQWAIFEPQRCPKAPCYAYSSYPAHKCPDGENQQLCAVLRVSSTKVVETLLTAETFR